MDALDAYLKYYIGGCCVIGAAALIMLASIVLFKAVPTMLVISMGAGAFGIFVVGALDALIRSSK